jgi:Zn-dependent M28 family amino/carboxypeptidase
MSSSPNRLFHLLAVVALVGCGVALGPDPSPAASPSAPPAHPGTPADPGGDTLGARDRLDAAALLSSVRSLAHDSMQGRRTGTPGNERARRLLIGAFDDLGLATVGDRRTHPFTVTPRGGGATIEGVNILGMVPGGTHPDRYLVVTAHYDHLGVRDGEIFNGADDNASGTAALVELGRWLLANPPRHSVILAALDAEEMGLQGARAFVADHPVPLDRVVMNLNMDMVSRNEADELYAAGTYHYPFLVPVVEEGAALSRISLLMGHDRPDLPAGDDWTMSSDHGPFHQAGIPFLYFGVEDHPGYHSPGDVFEDITPGFYIEAVETILDVLLLVDRTGERILEARSGG